ncbi:MAG TPA: ABC transporter ATP-binding protein [Firmicutes bacterium]|jgi:ABC-type multidrug transport system ATPase subunit|nr:ABC transporter ATP-binding protein [Bacillota bacterium]
MIQTEGLTKRFGQLVAVDNLNIHVEKGEIYGFLGPNGAGKTTTAMMILGLLKPTEGKVKIFGKELQEDYFNIKRRIGVLSEFQYLYEDLTAYECLRFFGELYQVDDIDKRITHVLGLVNLDNRKHELLGGYSKGMKQKFGMARALLHDPEILILDEPVSSLDPYGVKEIRDIIMEENRNGRTFLISSHILSEIERTCNRIGILNRGRLVAEDTMENLRRRLEDEVELHIEIDAPNEAVTKAIQGINGVISVDADEKQYVIKTSTERDVRPDIVRAIAATGNVVVEMRRHEMSLEEAFVTITEKNISLLAKEGVA